MTTLRPLVLPLRILLIGTLLATVLVQLVALPVALADIAEGTTDLAPVAWPLAVIGGIGLVGVEVVIVCTWRLLTLVRDDQIFSSSASRFVDTITVAIGGAWVFAAIAAVLVITAQGLPGLGLILLLALLIGAAIGLLVVVLRSLLHQATTLRDDLDGVI